MGFNVGSLAAAFPVSAIANVGMAAGSGMLNYASQTAANRDNITLAKETMDWQKMMSNTAHQREVQDLKDAGLNPILSAGGNGASTPSGSTPSMVAPQIDMPGLYSMISSAVQLDQNQQKIDIDKANSMASIAEKGAKTAKVQGPDTKKTESDVALNRAKQILLQKGMPRAILEGKGADVLQKMIEWTEKYYNKAPSPEKRSYGPPGYRRQYNRFQVNKPDVGG